MDLGILRAGALGQQRGFSEQASQSSRLPTAPRGIARVTTLLAEGDRIAARIRGAQLRRSTPPLAE
jgi:hypothetical protein